MSLISDAVRLLTSQYGWIVVLAYIAYQIYWPLSETRLQAQINKFDHKLNELNDKQVASTQVIRALARVNDAGKSDVHIDSDRVDEYLVRNGVEPDDFITADSELPTEEDQ